MRTIKKLFITGIGSRDPYAMSKEDNTQTEGAVLTACRNIKPDVVYLLPILNQGQTEGPMMDKAMETQEVIKTIEPLNSVVEILPLHPVSPVDYFSLSREFLNAFETIYRQYPESGYQYHTSITSGTAQMATLLLILKENGILKGELVQIKAPQFTSESSRVTTVDLSFLELIQERKGAAGEKSNE